MRAITIVATTGPNPAYDMRAARQARADGKFYDVSPDIEFPVGTVFDHPHVWLHCCLAVPTMAPHDDACRAKVHAFVHHPRRKALLAKIKHMSSPAVLPKLPAGLQTYVKALSQKWAAQMEDVAADETATVAEITAAFTVDDDADGDDHVESDRTFGSL